MHTISEILKYIRNGHLLHESWLTSFDHDQILDARDSDQEFDINWTKCFGEINAMWNNADVDAASKDIIDQIREEAFRAVANATQSHEISSYVSDDFDLIARSLHLNLKKPFVNLLETSYKNCQFPDPSSEFWQSIAG